MQNSAYILVPSAGGQQLQIPVAVSSTGATKVNSGHAVVVSNVNNAHGANLTVGKSVLNVRTLGPNLTNSWKSGEAASRPANTQTHPVRFIVASSKDGFVNVPDFASLAADGRTSSTTVNPNSSRVALVKHSSGGAAGAVQKIAPATATSNLLTSVPNGSLRAMTPSANKVPGRTAPVALFPSNAAGVVPKTAGSTGTSLWTSLSVANSTVTGSSTTSTSPSKQLIIQLAPEQLVCCHFTVL